MRTLIEKAYRQPDDRALRTTDPLFSGAAEAVALSAAHDTTGLDSGSPRILIDTVTGDKALKGRFKAMISTDQAKQGKPSPDIYLAVTEILGVSIKMCLPLKGDDATN